MAKQSLATIKNWFRTRLKPTQGQYWDTWDSFWHKDETIPVEKVEDLADLLAGKATNERVDNVEDQLHPPVTINPDCEDYASIDENQVLNLNIAFPLDVDSSSTNSLTANSHTHALGDIVSKSAATLMGDTMIVEYLPPSADPHNPWHFDCSDDGSVIIVAGMKLYVSTDFGETWTPKEPFAASATYGSVKCSSDGSIMWTAYRNPSSGTAKVIVSSDFGGTWSDVTPPSGTLDFYTIGVSQNGESAIVGVNNGGVYKTINRGASWTLVASLGVSYGIPSWANFAISNDGLHIIACKTTIDTLISINGGSSFIDYWHGYQGWPLNVSAPATFFVQIKGDKSSAAISHDWYENEMGKSNFATIVFYNGLESPGNKMDVLKSSYAPTSFIDKNITVATGFGQLGTDGCIFIGSINDTYPTYYTYDPNAIPQLFPGFINASKSLLYWFNNHGGDDFGKITFKKFISDAPSDGKLYGRKNGAWVEIII